jgi:hypothetical protein
MWARTLELELGGCASFAEAREENHNGYEEGYHDTSTYACTYAGFGCG